MGLNSGLVFSSCCMCPDFGCEMVGFGHVEVELEHVEEELERGMDL